MSYITGLLAGTGTLFLSLILFVLGWVLYLRWRYAEVIPSGASVGFDISSLVYNPLLWVVGVLGFTIGFAWGFSRGS